MRWQAEREATSSCRSSSSSSSTPRRPGSIRSPYLPCRTPVDAPVYTHICTHVHTYVYTRRDRPRLQLQAEQLQLHHRVEWQARMHTCTALRTCACVHTGTNMHFQEGSRSIDRPTQMPSDRGRPIIWPTLNYRRHERAFPADAGRERSEGLATRRHNRCSNPPLYCPPRARACACVCVRAFDRSFVRSCVRACVNLYVRACVRELQRG